MSKEINKQAKAIFSRYPKLSVLYVNSKGEFFTRKDLAENSLSKEDHLTELNRQSVKTDDKEPLSEMSVAKLSEHLEAVKELPVAEQLLKDEIEGQNRKTAIAAIEDKIEDLKAGNDES